MRGLFSAAQKHRCRLTVKKSEYNEKLEVSLRQYDMHTVTLTASPQCERGEL